MAAPKTKDDYLELGRQAAQQPFSAGPCGNSWQAKAYNEGYANEKARMKLEDAGMPKRPAFSGPLSAHMPQAVREHLARLDAELQKKLNPARQARLMKAQMRMYKRYPVPEQVGMTTPVTQTLKC